MRLIKLTAAIAILTTPALTGCSLVGLLITATQSAENGAAVGNVAALGDDYYDPCGEDFGNVLEGAAADFAGQMRTDGWTVTDQNTNASVTAADIYNNENTDDAIFYTGHGIDGVLLFSNYCVSGAPIDQKAWGVGDDVGDYANPKGIPIPAGSRLKWIFADSSDTVAPPSSYLANQPQVTAEWHDAFVYKGLHGIYGFWQGPPATPSGCFNGDRLYCDLNIDTAPEVAHALPGYLYSNTHPPTTVHNAWAFSARDAGLVVGYSEMEDSQALNDTFGAPGSAFQFATASGNPIWYWSGSLGAISVPPESVSATTFTLNPVVTAPAVVNDQTLINEATPYVSSITETNNGQLINLYTPTGVGVLHNYATSGALSFHGYAYYNTVGFSAATAQTAATTFVQQSLGLPADAVLASENADYVYNPSSGSTTITGYSLTWRHTVPTLGDQIVVFVDDDTVSTVTCTGGWESVLIPPNPHPVEVCKAETTTITHTPNISYAFYQWHAPVAQSTTRTEQSAGRSTGQQSIDAYTASLSLPAGDVVTSYTAGYWFGGVTDPTTTGQSAWLFTVNGTLIIAVDAFSGAILGTRSL